MAARWGAGEETLTIGGMELFTAGGPLQCHSLEEHGGCDGLSDLALSSLDAGILGTFQGYIDNSIISIIDDSGVQAENKGHFDEENELSLLTALTEILDNADDENMSPFDSIPDSELLVSPKDRDGGSLQKFLSLSRTPPDREIAMDDQRHINYAKVDVRCSGPNWDLFPDTISSTPKRHTRHKSIRACLPRRAITEQNLQRSDGEEEDDHLTEKNFGESNVLDKDIAMDLEEIGELDSDLLMKQDTPCIINTENVALNDLVKYMHPYCLPAITVCIDTEDEENLLDEAVFLEVVSEQGETIKVPVIVEPSEDLLNYQSSEEDMPMLEVMQSLDCKSQALATPESTSEQHFPDLDVNTENISNEEEKSELSEQAPEPIENVMERMPVLEKVSAETVMTEGTVEKVKDNHVESESVSSDGKESDLKSKPFDEMEVNKPNSDKEKASLKGRKTSKKKQPYSLKSKTKMKNKSANEEKPREAQEMSPSNQAGSSSLSNPSLQESDLLIKTLDQVKESQMELRSAKATRSKTRLRPSSENPEKRLIVENVRKETITVDAEQPKSVVEPKADLCSKSAENVDLCPQSDSVLEPRLNDKSCFEDVTTPVSDSNSDCAFGTEVKETTEQVKELKPKSLSLSEYRKRLQNRKPSPEKENENLSCSKWPSIPEPPKELAELPCLITMPAKANKTAVEEKQTPSKSENTSAHDDPANVCSTPTIPVSSLSIQDHLPKKQEEPCPAAMDTTPPPLMPSQPNIPPNIPPPFFPPAWPTIPSHPPYYPGLPPPLPAVPPFPNAIPSMLPIQPPPPVMNWPPFPPPPIAMGPVHPNTWLPGIPPPYWANPLIPQGVPEPPIAFGVPNQHMLPERKIPLEAPVPPISHNQTKQSLEKKPENIRSLKDKKMAEPLNRISPDKSAVKSVCPSKSALKVSSEGKKSEVTSATINSSESPESKSSGLATPNLNSANDVVVKIMEILKKAQKCGFQITLPPQPLNKTPETSLAAPRPTEVNGVKPATPKTASVSDAHTKELYPAVVAKPTTSAEESKQIVATPASLKAVPHDVLVPPTVNNQTRPPNEVLNPSLPSSNREELAETFEKGIEASDLASLLEEFEKSEAKDEERLPHSPDKMAVGNSGAEKTMEKILLDKHLAPELVNTAGLTPPATPPHQLWKTLGGNPNGKKKPLPGNVREKPCSSPLKTAKLIDPKPLPQSKLKNRHLRAAPSGALPPVHVASGDHDYCILSASQMEEGSRWNVKHHKNIVIKPILPFNKQPQNNACPNQTNALSAVCNRSANCASNQPVAPCRNSPKDTNDPLDHRTNIAESAVKCPPGSVLMSPNASPCHSENGEAGTDVKKENSSGSRRSLRCYRKYRNSPSPQASPWRGRSRDSFSDSSSSSSRSRSRSPPSKRRRKSRSRNPLRSRSSSRSSCSSSSSSRSSSPSSRLCSPSSSRSRSPYSRGYRSRSRRCESQESSYNQKMYRKERAIEERRVVYIGNIDSQMTRSELRKRFSSFGEIEECTIHFREHGDNYGFVTYQSIEEASTAIKEGHKLRLPDELPFDLCFGGRRQFCKSNYVDLDSLHDQAPARSKYENLDFDKLLKQAQKRLQR